MPPRATRKRSTRSTVKIIDHIDHDGDTVVDDGADDYVPDEEEEEEEDDYEDADVDDEEEDEPEEDEPEEIEEPEEVRYRKTSKPRKSGPKPASGPKYVRTLKDLSSIQDKLTRMYGDNHEKMLYLVRQRLKWCDYVVDFPEELVEDLPVAEKPVVEYDFKGAYIPITISEVEELLPSRISSRNFMFDTDSEIRNFPSGDTIPFPDFEGQSRTGMVHNVGGLVTNMCWLDGEHLVVSYTNIIDDVTNNKFKMTVKNEYFACLAVYKVDIVQGTLVKRKSIIHSFGSCWNMKPLPNYHGQGLGAVGGVFPDGTIKFFQIMDDEQEFLLCETADINITLENRLITCFDFLDDNTVICGLDNGYITEFVVNDPELPSYLEHIHDCYIISIAVGRSKYENTACWSTSVDGYSMMFDPLDLRNSMKQAPRMRQYSATVEYCQQLFSFIQAEGFASLKCYPVGCTFAYQPLVSHSSTVEAMSVTPYHPFILSGAADGSVCINNPIRKILNTIKQLAPHKYARLWKWDYDLATDAFKLDHNYSPESLVANEATKIVIQPHDVRISSVKWNDKCAKGAKWFAFSNNAGFIVLEKL